MAVCRVARSTGPASISTTCPGREYAVIRYPLFGRLPPRSPTLFSKMRLSARFPKAMGAMEPRASGSPEHAS